MAVENLIIQVQQFQSTANLSKIARIAPALLTQFEVQ